MNQQHNTKEMQKRNLMEQDLAGTSSRIVLGILTGLCSFNGINPLAPSFFMATTGELMEKLILWICITGSIFVRLGIEDAFRYGTIMMVSFLLSQMGQAICKEEIHKKALITGIATSLLTLIKLLWIADIGSVAFWALTEGFMSLGLVVLIHSALGYEKSRRRLMEQEELLGWLLLLSGILYGIALPFSAGISIRQGMVWFLVLYSAYRFGIAEATIFGIFLGGVLYYKGEALSFGTASIFYACGFYALCGMGAGIGRKIGRVVSVCLMGAIAFALFRWAQDLRSENWYGILFGSALFLVLPQTVVSMAKQEKGKEFLDETLLFQVRNQLKDFSEAFKRIKMTLLFSTGEWEEHKEQEQILEHTVQEVCSQCEYNNYCWDTEARLSYEQVGAVMEHMELSENMEEFYENPFLVRCPKQEAFLAEIRHGFEMNKLETMYNERILEGREAMAGQFEQVARIIDDLFNGMYKVMPIPEKTRMKLEASLKAQKVKLYHVSQVENRAGQKEVYVAVCSERGRMLTARELGKIIEKTIGYPVRSKSGNRTVIGKKMGCYGFLEESEFYYLQGVARVSKTASDISGDNFSILEYEPGKLGVMLADGMGSGDYANKKSALLVELMERLLEAGFARDASLRLLNAVLVTPVSEANFSTLDLCMVDLYKGQYDFYKVGGSASFIKRGDQVQMIPGGSVPVGIFPNLEYDSYEANIQDGDMLFLLSDGVMESVPAMEKEEFIAEEIKKLLPVSPQEMAVRLMSRIQELGGQSRRDDITILVIGIWKRV